MTGRLPLVVVTRDERYDDTLSRALAARGTRPLALQTIAVEPAEDLGPLRAALAGTSGGGWIVFTSAHAVDVACGAAPSGAGRTTFAPARVAAVGRRTAARLAAYGIDADLVPEDASAAGLAAALSAACDLRGCRVVWPTGDLARPELAEALGRAGARLDAIEVYRTVAVRPAGLDAFVRDLGAGSVDAVLFLSPSSARGLAAALPDGTLASLAGHTLVGSIGPTTTRMLEALGVVEVVEPPDRSAESLADTVVHALLARRVQV